MQRQKRQHSVFARDMISLIGIGLVACLVVGLVFLSMSMVELETITTQESFEKLDLAVLSLDSYLEIMENITLRIRTTPCYRPEFLRFSTLNQRTMMDDFRKFVGYLPFSVNYYLYYSGTDEVYSPSAKYDANMFFRYIMLNEDYDTLKTLLFEERTVAPVQLSSIPGQLIIRYPFTLFGDEATVLFAIQEEELLDRLSQMSGLNRDKLGLCWQNSLLCGTDISEKVISKSTNLEGLEISTSTDSITLRTDGLTTWLLIALAVVILVIIALAVNRAKINYKPIQRILQNYVSDGGDLEGNEFEVIECILETAVHTSFVSQRQVQSMILLINEQRDRLREALLCHILQGNNISIEEAELEGVGLHFVGRRFALWKMSFLDRRQQKQVSAELESRTEEEDGITLIPVMINHSGDLFIIANYENEEDLTCIDRFFEELSDRYHPTSMVFGGSGQSLDTLGELRRNIEEEGRLHNRIMLGKLSDALESGDESGVLRLIRQIASQKHSSAEEMKGIGSEILSRLVSLPQPEMMRRTAVKIMSTMGQGDIQTFINEVEKYASEIFALDKSKDGDEITEEILKYIEDNLCAYDLNLKQLADQFNISTRFASELIKNRTGLSYIDYIRVRRMEYAEKLLLESQLSVTEIGERLGYTNISYFIRTFKGYTGSTPVSYRKERAHQNQTGENGVNSKGTES